MSSDNPKPSTAADGGGSGQQGNNTSKGNNNNNNSNSNNNKSTKTAPKFYGNTEAMKGHVFELPVTKRNADQFPKGMEMLRQFVAKTYASATEMQSLFVSNPRTPAVPRPPPFAEKTSPVLNNKGEETFDADGNVICESNDFDKEFHRTQVQQYFKDTRQLKVDMGALYNVIYGQCNKDMRSSIDASDKNETKRQNGDCLWILDHIRSAISRFKDTHYALLSARDALFHFYTLKQHQSSNSDYYTTFTRQVETLDRNNVWSPPPLALFNDSSVTSTTPEEKRATLKEMFLATCFLMGSDPSRYGDLVRDLKNQYALGQNNFPRTVLDAFQLLNQRATTTAEHQRRTTRPRPNNDSKNTNNNNHGFFMRHVSLVSYAPSFPPEAILIDSGATDSLFRNEQLLHDIGPRDPPLRMNTNGGSTTTNLQLSLIHI